MPRLRIKLDDPQPNDRELQDGLSTLTTNAEAMQFVKTMFSLLKSGELGFWLSPRLARKVKALVLQRQGINSPSTQDVDEEAFMLFLQQGGNIEPDLRWEVESLNDNGAIYRNILKGGRGEGIYNNQG